MKLYQLLIVALLTTTVLHGNVAAEYQDDNKIFGNGRFLRRLRNDSAKKPQPKSKDAKQPSKNTKADPRVKVPTPAGKRPTGNVPTPAARAGHTPRRAAQPSAVARPTKSSPMAPLTRNSAPNNVAVPSFKEQPINSRKSKASRKGDAPPTGFGMQLELKSDKITVTRIDPRGNAHQAGLKKGDVILNAGGVELGSTEEFDEITKILGQGDELEFNVESRGKKKDILIQFGTVTEDTPVANSSQPKKDNDYSFVPDGDDNSKTGLHSVLGRPKENVSRSTPTRSPGNEQRMIEQQRRQIEQMQQEIQRLKRQLEIVPASVDPIENAPVIGGQLSDGLDLSGPGN